MLSEGGPAHGEAHGYTRTEGAHASSLGMLVSNPVRGFPSSVPLSACVTLPIVQSRCLPVVLHVCNVLPRERKLMYRVVFPFELKLPNTTDDAAGRDALYSLFAVVVHVGSGPHHGALKTPNAGDWRCAVSSWRHMLVCFVVPSASQHALSLSAQR